MGTTFKVEAARLANANFVTPDLLPPLSLEQAEYFCTIDSNPHPELMLFQLSVAKQLQEAYQYGCVDISPDQKLAKKYQEQADYLRSKLNISPRSSPAIQNTGFFNTELGYKLVGWFTSLRLFAIRWLRIFPYLALAIAPLAVVTIPVWATYLMASYIAELFLHIGIVLKSALTPYPIERPENAEQGKPPASIGFWQRLKNALNKGDRPYRLGNALVWGVIAIISIIAISNPLTFPLIAIAPIVFVNLVGFIYDIFNEADHKDYGHITDFAKLTKKECDTVKSKHLRASTATDEVQHSLTYRHSLLSYIHNQTNIKRESARDKKIRAVCVAVFILLGMALFAAAPYVPLAITIMGAVTALIAGSIIGGFGKRLFDGFIDCFKRYFENPVPEVGSPLVHSNSLQKNLGNTAEITISLDSQIPNSTALEEKNENNSVPNAVESSSPPFRPLSTRRPQATAPLAKSESSITLDSALDSAIIHSQFALSDAPPTPRTDSQSALSVSVDSTTDLSMVSTSPSNLSSPAPSFSPLPSSSSCAASFLRELNKQGSSHRQPTQPSHPRQLLRGRSYSG